jgi:acyl carrier protein
VAEGPEAILGAEGREVILGEVRRILSQELGKEGPVEGTQELARDLGLDSMGAIILAVGLEDRFRVKLPSEEAGRIVTVGDLVEVVRACLVEKARGEEAIDLGGDPVA